MFGDYYRDEYGRYEVFTSVYYEDEDVTVEYRKYENNKRIKTVGGMYCLYCYETENRSHFRNDYMAMHGLPAFIRANSQKSVVYLVGGEFR